jgi:hypothetical protein
MFIHDDYDDSYDVRQLQRLPMYQNMTEKEIRHLMTKIAVMEQQQWEAEVKAMLLSQRKNTLEYIAKMEIGEGYKPLPSEPVEIYKGVRIYPSLMDDQGFISDDRLDCLKKTMRLSLSGNRKIYL